MSEDKPSLAEDEPEDRSKESASQANKLSSAKELDDLNAAERRTIDRHSSPSAALVHETIRGEGQAELDRSNGALIMSGLSAGLSIGMSVVVEGLLRQHLPHTSWAEIVVPMGYSVGFVIVVLGRQQLFTENTLTPILPLLFHWKMSIFRHVLRLWGLVLASNLVATLLFALFLAKTPVFPPETQAAFAEVSRAVYGSNFAETFWSSLMAGWLIALMVWILPASGSARPLVIFAMTYLVGLCKLSHSIAGSVEGFYLVLTGAQSIAHYFTIFLIPTVIGNIFGGVGLVAVLNYGQVVSEIKS